MFQMKSTKMHLTIVSDITRRVETSTARFTELLMMGTLKSNPSNLCIDESHVRKTVVCYFSKFTRGDYIREEEGENKDSDQEIHFCDFS